MSDKSQFPILHKLKRLSWRPDNPNLGECQCPAHEDSTNSLHTTIKHCDDGQTKLMFHCHAGCTVADILRALGEGFSSLFPDRTKQPKQTAGKGGAASAGNNEPKLVKVYDYHDADGQLLHQTLRWEPKLFTQRRRAEPNTVYQVKGQDRKSFKDPHGNWWINSLSGIEPVIYRLPEILKADPRKVIFLCEGEKDADNLKQKFGVYTTTVPMGAGKWRPSYTQTFRGRRVIIIPDFDKPRKGQTDPEANAGFDGARRVAAELVKVALEVRICYLPNLNNQLTPKWDLSDWLAAGGTKAQFLEACNAAPVLHVGHPGLIPAGMESQDARSSSSDGSSPSSPVDANATQVVSNFVKNSEGENIPIPMSAILKTIKAVTGGPYRVGNSLFTFESGKVYFLNSPSALFGWLGSRLPQPPEFCRASSCHSKSEVFDELCRLAEEFAAIEFFPHEPEIPGHFYAFGELKESNGQHLRWLVNRFCPANDIDSDLILASFLTLFCGLPGGARPVILITADGPGAGKTTLATILGMLAGGLIDVSAKDDIHAIKERLLSPEGKRRRLGVLDNLKTMRFSWAEFESLITTPTISGRELYKGESQRPNLLTWVLTINGVSLSKDMSQRCVIIELKRPEYSGTWKEETLAYVEEHRDEIISDIVSLLREPRKPLAKFTRWGAWEREVISRLPLPAEAQKVIMERQEASDVDTEECDEIEAYFAKRLERLGYSSETNKVAIPSDVCCEWLSLVLRKRFELKGSTSLLKTYASNGSITRLSYLHRKSFRGFIWSGEHCRPGETAYVDIADRLIRDRLEGASLE